MNLTLPLDTITAAFARAVAAVPDRIFLDCQGATLTFAEVDALSTRYAHGLAAAGAKKGEPVALMLDNNLEHVLLWLAINKLGAISAPVNTGFKGHYLRNQLADSDAGIAIAEAAYCTRIAEIEAELPRRLQLFSRGEADSLSEGKPAALDWLLSQETTPIEDSNGPLDTALLVYTSGTTGNSKGCMIPHNLPCNLAWGAVHYRGVKAGDVIWSPLPLFHLNAIAVVVVTALVAQCTAAIAPRFSVSNFWPEIRRTGATVVSLLGSLAALLADAEDNADAQACVGQIRLLMAAPFPLDIAAKWQQRFGVVSRSAGAYGMTEAATITGTLPDDTPPAGSSGRSGLDFDVRIVDEIDRELPRGEVGEIVCRPRAPGILFSGYWRKPEATLQAFGTLWFHTGDLGRMDANGYLFFADRKKDYIRRRGENISSTELEAIFRKHPALRDVAVHAVLSPLGEDDVKVTAELVTPGAVSAEDLCRWSIDRVPYFAVPLYIEFRDELPRSATGKVLKNQLREEGKTSTTWDREAAGLRFERR
ncbi:MAG: AMP-binding protein [Spongiibacteraceae bacterium]